MEPFYQLSAEKPNGESISFDSLRGSVVLIVNTASKCGFTPQYDGLQKLYEQYKDRGLVILGFPCNQFGNQEPLKDGSIGESCRINYGVTFPLAKKSDVNGSNAHPVFRYLKTELPGMITNAVKWNFTKFLVDAEGHPVRRFSPATTPEQIASFIEELLPQK